MHSPSTASGVATALRASKSRQNHSSVCSGSPLRSRPVKGQPPAPNARLGAAPPCELQPRRWPTQLTLREACPGSGMKRGVFFRPSSHLSTYLPHLHEQDFGRTIRGTGGALLLLTRDTTFKDFFSISSLIWLSDSHVSDRAGYFREVRASRMFVC